MSDCNGVVKTINISNKKLASVTRVNNGVDTRVNLAPKENAFKIMEEYIKSFRADLNSESNGGANYINLKVFSLDKTDIPELDVLNWLDMFNFSQDNNEIKELKEDCANNDISCYVKEKGGTITIMCSSDEFILRKEVNKLRDIFNL